MKKLTTFTLSLTAGIVIIILALATSILLVPAAKQTPSTSIYSDGRMEVTSAPAYEEYAADSVEPALNESTAEYVIYTGSITMRVASVNDSLQSISTIASQYGGYVEYSAISLQDEATEGTVRIRVEQSQFNQAMRDIEALAEVVRFSSTSSDDVTETVVDLEARLANAQQEEAQYLAVLEQAANVEDILAVHKYLSDIRETIERYQTHLDYYQQATSLSTITVTMTEETSVILDSDTFRPGQSVIEAVQAVIEIAQAAVIGIIWIVIVGGAIGLPVLLLAWLIKILYKRIK